MGVAVGARVMVAVGRGDGVTVIVEVLEGRGFFEGAMEGSAIAVGGRGVEEQLVIKSMDNRTKPFTLSFRMGANSFTGNDHLISSALESNHSKCDFGILQGHPQGRDKGQGCFPVSINLDVVFHHSISIPSPFISSKSLISISLTISEEMGK